MPEVNYVYWKDQFGGSSARSRTKTGSYAYKIGSSGAYNSQISSIMATAQIRTKHNGTITRPRSG